MSAKKLTSKVLTTIVIRRPYLNDDSKKSIISIVGGEPQRAKRERERRERQTDR